MLKLSILICSVVDREDYLEKLMKLLKPQASSSVEILVNVDKREKTIGEKRNELLFKSFGQYVAFVDDDDTISDDYVSKIMKAIINKPDCCGIEGMVITKGREDKKFIHSVKFPRWFDRGDAFCRCPNHLNPILRKYAVAVRFPHINKYEDRIYSYRLRSVLRKEVFIDGPIYYYNFIPRKWK
jgi:glycosyltransferase involved in cell wall biosynthesis